MTTTTTVPSRTHPGLTWTVTRWPGGRYSCDCPGHVNRHHCWHVDQLELMDALDRPRPARISEAARELQHLLDV